MPVTVEPRLGSRLGLIRLSSLTSAFTVSFGESYGSAPSRRAGDRYPGHANIKNRAFQAHSGMVRKKLL
jgi:hypothetical protein